MNDEAVAVLAYPNARKSVQAAEKHLSDKFKSLYSNRSGALISSSVTKITSGRRSYRCSMFPMTASFHHVEQSMTAILIQRNSQYPDMQVVADSFSLSQREREVVGLLAQGLTTKEIAQRMGISPNTVKVFVRLVMAKTNVTTRSGVLGKYLHYSMI
jgi:DNA-binding CsgD family transcriptional regulator